MTEAPSKAVEPMNSMLESIKGLMDVESFIPSFLEAKEFEETVKKFKPKANCNKCYGRGYTAIQVESRNHILCKCLKKSMVAGAKVEFQKNAN